MSVGKLCNREVNVAAGATTVAEAAALMRHYHVGDLVIVEESAGERKPVGLVTDRDLVVEVLAEGLDPESVTIANVMTRELQTVAEEADLWEAIGQMRRQGVRRLPVVNPGGGLEGILTLDDALELVADAMSGLVGLISREIEQEAASRPER